MKQSGKCPKCGNLEIWNNAHMGEFAKQWTLVWYKRFKREGARGDTYVCMGCGYKETYVNEKGLETIREYGSREIG